MKKQYVVVLAVLVLCVIGAFALFSAGKTVTLPYEGGDKDKLEISALYQFSGPNPDCDNQDGEDVASLTINNPEGNRFLQSAHITVTMKDKAKYEFVAEDIPAGKTVQAFDLNNTTYVQRDDKGNDIAIKSIKIDTKFSDDMGIDEKKFSVYTEEFDTSVQISNVSKKDVKNVKVYCHTNFDGEYYGGKAYEYPVGTIKKGATVMVDAPDCYIGTAEAVCIE